MQYSLVLASALMGVATAASSCSGSFDGKFEISVDNLTVEKRNLPAKRDVCGNEGILVLSLEDKTLKDAQGRTGYIASNYQFQFDAPPQDGTLVDTGFEVCENNVLSLAGNSTFFQCKSGTFYNLYDRNWAEQCEPVTIVAVGCGTADTVSQGSDGQIVGTTLVETTIVTALTDGQPQVITTTVPVTIYTTIVPVSEYTDGQVQVTVPATQSPPAPTSTSAPASSSPSAPAPTTSVSPGPSSSSAPVTSAPESSSSASESTTLAPTTSSSAPASSSPPATTSAPGTSGSSHVAAGSMGALVFGLLVAFVCL